MKLRKQMMMVSIFMILIHSMAIADGKPRRSGETQRGIPAEGACAIVGMSAEQSQLTALQRARAAVIEQAAGVSVSSGALVTNYTVAADFIKTYARGFIVSEKVVWLPLGQYQKDSSIAPIPEYRVRIIADVYVPEKKIKPLGLKAELNNSVFRAGEKARVKVRTVRAAQIAVFNIMADDRVTLLFPNAHEPENKISPGKEFIFPNKDAKVNLEMQPLPGHRKDAEAIFVIAWDKEIDIPIMKMFSPSESVPFGEFFKHLADIADQCEEMILPYEVVEK